MVQYLDRQCKITVKKYIQTTAWFKTDDVYFCSEISGPPTFVHMSADNITRLSVVTCDKGCGNRTSKIVMRCRRSADAVQQAGKEKWALQRSSWSFGRANIY